MSRNMGDVFLWTSLWDSTGMANAIACVGQTVGVSDESFAYLVSQYPGGSANASFTAVTMPDLSSEAPTGLTPYMLSVGSFPPQPLVFDDFSVPDDPFEGEVDYTTDESPARGWAICDGSLIPISQNVALYSVIGNSFGGDGKTNFALPTLVGTTTTPDGSLPVIATTGYLPTRSA